MFVKGIRGATTIDEDTKEEILEKTKELLLEMIAKNDIKTENLASAFFTATEDVTADFPAVAARELGWTVVPLLCAKELSIKGSLKSAVRVLLHYNSEKDIPVKHIYLRGAKVLRPDLEEK